MSASPSSSVPGSDWVLCLGTEGPVQSLVAELQTCAAWPLGLRLLALTMPLAGSQDQSAVVAALQNCAGAGEGASERPLCTLLVASPAMAESPATQCWRQALAQLNWPYAVLTGDAPQQTQLALQVVQHALVRAQRPLEAATAPRWRWVCADCDDGDCEQHWLPGAGA